MIIATGADKCVGDEMATRGRPVDGRRRGGLELRVVRRRGGGGRHGSGDGAAMGVERGRAREGIRGAPPDLEPGILGGEDEKAGGTFDFCPPDYVVLHG